MKLEANFFYIPCKNKSNEELVYFSNITIPETSTTTSPTPNPTPTPTVPEFSSWTIHLLLSLMVAAAGLLVYFKKYNRKTKNFSLLLCLSFLRPVGCFGLV